MRNPDRIHEICYLLEQIWKTVPDWRFGQLLCNLDLFNRRDHLNFYQEDNETLRRLRDVLKNS